MLHAGSYAIRSGKVIALVPADVGTRHRRTQIRILARTFLSAPPSRVSGDIHHGRIEPAHSRGDGLDRRDVGNLGHEGRIERCGQSEWNRVNSAITVKDVCAKEERDMQTALIDRRMLIRVGSCSAYDVKH